MKLPRANVPPPPGESVDADQREELIAARAYRALRGFAGLDDLGLEGGTAARIICCGWSMAADHRVSRCPSGDARKGQSDMTPPSSVVFPAGTVASPAAGGQVPRYLREHYTWAYIHPLAVWVFERQWLISSILWGNYRCLRDAALSALGGALPGRTLQVACVYGDLTSRLCERVVAGDGDLDIVDVVPIQLENLRRKLPGNAPVRLLARNSAELGLPDGSYDRAVLFFLLHEQPRNVRLRTLSEVFRVVKPGGTILIVDYARPSRWHPLRYLWLPFLTVLEPFASDLWRRDIADWLPEPWASRALRSASFCGGLYRQTIITR